MSPKMIVLECVAVLAGAVIGTVVGAFVAWLFAGADFFGMLAVPAHYILAVVTVTIFAVLYAYLPATPAVLASLVVGILLPSVIAKLAFGAAQGWGTILVLNLVFAVVALLTYRFVHANAKARDIAGDLSEKV